MCVCVCVCVCVCACVRACVRVYISVFIIKFLSCKLEKQYPYRDTSRKCRVLMCHDRLMKKLRREKRSTTRVTFPDRKIFPGGKDTARVPPPASYYRVSPRVGYYGITDFFFLARGTLEVDPFPVWRPIEA